MDGLRLVWDDKKNKANRRNHGVSFEEAHTAFFDENATEFLDPDHSQEEDRFLLLGLSVRLRVLVVCRCYRESQGVIRIISTRKATRKERRQYAGERP
jgi:uncharacterized DUF497 family protein